MPVILLEMLHQKLSSWKDDNSKSGSHLNIFDTITPGHVCSLYTRIEITLSFINASRPAISQDCKIQFGKLYEHIASIIQSPYYKQLSKTQKHTLQNLLALIYLQFAPNALPQEISANLIQPNKFLANLHSQISTIVQRADSQTLNEFQKNTLENLLPQIFMQLTNYQLLPTPNFLIALYLHIAAIIQNENYNHLNIDQKCALENILLQIYLQFAPNALPQVIKEIPIQPITFQDLLSDNTHFGRQVFLRNTVYSVTKNGQERPVILQCRILRTSPENAIAIEPRKQVEGSSQKEKRPHGAFIYGKTCVQVYGPGTYVNPATPASVNFALLSNIAEQTYAQVKQEYECTGQDINTLPPIFIFKERLLLNTAIQLQHNLFRTPLDDMNTTINSEMLKILETYFARLADLTRIMQLSAPCGGTLIRETHHTQPSGTPITYKNVAIELFMRKIPGTELSLEIARQSDNPTPNKFPRTFAILFSIIDDLDNIHSSGVTHRDIKEGNIIVAANGKAKIIDPGLAVHRRECESTSTYFTDTKKALINPLGCGSPLYCSKELWEMANSQQKIPPTFEMLCKADIYALGITLWILVCGIEPSGLDTADDLISFANNPNQFCIEKNGLPLKKLFTQQFIHYQRNAPEWQTLRQEQQATIIQETFGLIAPLLNSDWQKRPSAADAKSAALRLNELVMKFCNPSSKTASPSPTTPTSPATPQQGPSHPSPTAEQMAKCGICATSTPPNVTPPLFFSREALVTNTPI